MGSYSPYNKMSDTGASKRTFMFYTYKAVDQNGTASRGTLEARDEDELFARLVKQHLFLVTVRQAYFQSPGLGRMRRLLFRPSPQDIVHFFIQLGLLERSGVHLIDALGQLRFTAPTVALRDIAANLQFQISEGKSFSEAASRYPDIFNPIYAAMLRNGEKFGTLSETFEQITHHLRWEMEMRRKVHKALRYPLYMLIGMVILISLLMTYLVPQLTEFLLSLRIEFSVATRSLLWVSALARACGLYAVLALVMCGIAVVAVRTASPRGRELLDAAWDHVPFFGTTRRKVDLCNFTRLLALASKQDRSVQENLRLCGEVVSNASLRRKISLARHALMEGSGLSRALGARNIFSSMILKIIEVGENSENLPKTFAEISAYYNNDIERSVEVAVTVVQPLTLLCAALVLVWIILGTLMPLYGSIQSMGG
jgi:type II secretory pathway component PulF